MRAGVRCVSSRKRGRDARRPFRGDLERREAEKAAPRCSFELWRAGVRQGGREREPARAGSRMRQAGGRGAAGKGKRGETKRERDGEREGGTGWGKRRGKDPLPAGARPRWKGARAPRVAAERRGLPPHRQRSRERSDGAGRERTRARPSLLGAREERADVARWDHPDRTEATRRRVAAPGRRVEAHPVSCRPPSNAPPRGRSTRRAPRSLRSRPSDARSVASSPFAHRLRVAPASSLSPSVSRPSRPFLPSPPRLLPGLPVPLVRPPRPRTSAVPPTQRRRRVPPSSSSPALLPSLARSRRSLWPSTPHPPDPPGPGPAPRPSSTRPPARRLAGWRTFERCTVPA